MSATHSPALRTSRAAPTSCHCEQPPFPKYPPRPGTDDHSSPGPPLRTATSCTSHAAAPGWLSVCPAPTYSWRPSSSTWHPVGAGWAHTCLWLDTVIQRGHLGKGFTGSPGLSGPRSRKDSAGSREAVPRSCKEARTVAGSDFPCLCGKTPERRPNSHPTGSP